MLKVALLFFLFWINCFAYHSIQINSSKNVSNATQNLEASLKKMGFQIIKTIRYKEQDTSIILFDDKDFLKKFQNSPVLLRELPFKIVISPNTNSKDKVNKSSVSYQDFEELNRYDSKQSSIIDELAKKMILVIKKADL